MQRLPIVLLCTISVCACNEMPDASAAQAAFAAQRSTVASIDRRLRAEVARLPMTRVVRCRDAAEVARSNDPVMNQEFEACSARRSEWLSSSIAARERFPREVLLPMLDEHHRVLGIEVKLSLRDEPQWQEVELQVGTDFASNPGVDARSGVGVEDYRLGWHLYQTAFAFVPQGQTEYVHVGDGEKRPGIEIVWSFTEGDVTAEILLVLLIDSETDARWRAGHRRARARRA